MQQQISLMNTNNNIQSAVSLIIRCQDELQENQTTLKNQNNFHSKLFKVDTNLIDVILKGEILFIQRQIRKSDTHSGQIAFPGGKNENNESDLDAAIRETQEEIGLDLKEIQLQCIYLGRLLPNYYVRKTCQGQIQKKLYCCGHVFLVYDRNRITDNLKLQNSEIRQIKWVSLVTFMDVQNMNIRKEQILSQQFKSYSIGALKPLFNIVYNNFQSLNLPQIDVKMDEQLWGLSFYMLIAFLNEIFLADKKKASELNSIITFSKYSEFKFKNNFMGGNVLKYFLKQFHHQSRIKPTFQRKQDEQYNIIIVSILMIIFLIIWIIKI